MNGPLFTFKHNIEWVVYGDLPNYLQVTLQPVPNRRGELVAWKWIQDLKLQHKLFL